MYYTLLYICDGYQQSPSCRLDHQPVAAWIGNNGNSADHSLVAKKMQTKSVRFTKRCFFGARRVVFRTLKFKGELFGTAKQLSPDMYQCRLVFFFLQKYSFFVLFFWLILPTRMFTYRGDPENKTQLKHAFWSKMIMMIMLIRSCFVILRTKSSALTREWGHNLFPRRRSR